VCTEQGVVFDVKYIVSYVKKYKRNPVNGQPLNIKDLIPLKFHRPANNPSVYHCPVLFKVFNDHSHIVANRKSGHVYSYEAIDELNRKAKHWYDLMTNEPFGASDIITIQDPHNVAARKIEDFDFIKRGTWARSTLIACPD
jgi:peptidyl-prolyl cis-trans isomerase-like 2